MSSANVDGIQEMMAILFDKKEEIGDGNYLRCCDILKDMHTQITPQPDSEVVERLRAEIVELTIRSLKSELRVINIRKKISEAIVENSQKKNYTRVMDCLRRFLRICNEPVDIE